MADLAPLHSATLTYEDYVRLPEDGCRYEILEGELLMTPAPSSRHQRISRNLEFLLFAHLKGRDLGEVLYAPFDVIFQSGTVAQPDLLYVSKEREAIITDRGAEGAPDLIVEITSPASSRTDRIRKFEIYSKFGVSWYWLLDPESQTFEEYELAGNSYVRRGSCAEDDVFTPLLFPGLEIPLSEVWA